MKFQTSRRVMWVLWSISALAIFVSLMVSDSNLRNYLLIAALVVQAAGIFILMKYWKCPYCHTQLPYRDKVVTVCPKCGKTLVEKDAVNKKEDAMQNDFADTSENPHSSEEK